MKPTITLAHLHELVLGWGWKVESWQKESKEGKVDGPIAIYQDAGRRDWQQVLGDWPEQCTLVDTWPVPSTFVRGVALTDRLLPKLARPSITEFFRPPTLTLGVQGTLDSTSDEIWDCVCDLLDQHQVSLWSLTALAGEAQHKHNAELIDLAEKLNVPFLVYTMEKLQKHPAAAEPQPPSKCALAAMFAAGAKDSLASGVSFGAFSLSLARRTWT